MVVSSAWLMPAIVGLRSPLSTPWNWKPWRVVTRSVPLPCAVGEAIEREVLLGR